MIEFTQNDNVARITINSPDTGNRFTYQIMSDFIAALKSASDSDSKILVINAKGKDFTLGRDQKEQLPHISRRENLGLILEANAALRAFPGVSIALINGHALGFGSGVALHSTISIAADNAVLGFDEIIHDLAPLIVVAYLPHFIAPRIAEELVLTGREVLAVEAQHIGLVSRVVPADELEAAGQEVVNRLGSHSHSALRLIREFSNRLPGYPSEELNREAVERLASWIESGRP